MFSIRIEHFTGVGTAIADSPVDKPGFFVLADDLKSFFLCIFFEQSSRLIKVICPSRVIEHGKAGHKRVITLAPEYPASARGNDSIFGKLYLHLPVFLGNKIIIGDVADLESADSRG